MRTCEQIKTDFVEALYGELDSHRQRSLQAHLKACADCRREFESLRRTLEVMSRRQRPRHRAPSAGTDATSRESSEGSRTDERRHFESSIEALQERILAAARQQDDPQAAADSAAVEQPDASAVTESDNSADTMGLPGTEREARQPQSASGKTADAASSSQGPEADQPQAADPLSSGQHRSGRPESIAGRAAARAGAMSAQGPRAVRQPGAQRRTRQPGAQGQAGQDQTPARTASPPQPAAYSKSRSNWQWLMQMAAGIALIALGVLIGRMTMNQAPSPDGTPTGIALAPDSPAGSAGQAASGTEAEALALRVGGYVSSSQSLLIGLANLDTEAEGMESFDLAPQRQLSRHLLKEASYLRNTLDGRESRELVELIGDLESILRQIANLEARHDVEGIDIIREGVESSGILIKIQLQKIRPHPVVREQDAKKRDAA